jgi:hypothetical protein
MLGLQSLRDRGSNTNKFVCIADNITKMSRSFYHFVSKSVELSTGWVCSIFNLVVPNNSISISIQDNIDPEGRRWGMDTSSQNCS